MNWGTRAGTRAAHVGTRAAHVGTRGIWRGAAGRAENQLAGRQLGPVRSRPTTPRPASPPPALPRFAARGPTSPRFAPSRARARVRGCVRACVRACVHACMRASSRELDRRFSLRLMEKRLHHLGDIFRQPDGVGCAPPSHTPSFNVALQAQETPPRERNKCCTACCVPNWDHQH